MAESPVPQNIPGIAISLLPNPESVDSFQPPNVNSSIIQYQDEREQQNSALQIVFEKHVGDNGNTFVHEEAAVLLLSWDDKCNDLKTESEVCDIL